MLPRSELSHTIISTQEETIRMKVICSQRTLRLSDQCEIHIPFGLSKSYKIALSNPEATLYLDKDKIICIKASDFNIQVYPHYSKAISIPKLPPLTFSVVVSEKDKKACTNLISQVHYLPCPNKGVFFAIKDRDEVIACCIIDTLNFGNPKGRYYINQSLCEALNIEYENWGATPSEVRATLQDQLKLTWVSRIARAPKYSDYQIGTQLILEVLMAIPVVIPHQVKHVEIIRTCPIEKSEARDFIEHAGFTKIKLRNQSSPSFNSSGDLFPKRQPCVKYYYWKKLAGESRVENSRLFVPLSQDPFSWFSDGKKTWELRRSRGQFTEQHIYTGRSVELRLGYSTSKKIWGIINKVVTGETIDVIFSRIGGFQGVIPTASSFSDAVERAQNILGVHDGSYIAFEITAIINPDEITCQI